MFDYEVTEDNYITFDMNYFLEGSWKKRERCSLCKLHPVNKNKSTDNKTQNQLIMEAIDSHLDTAMSNTCSRCKPFFSQKLTVDRLKKFISNKETISLIEDIEKERKNAENTFIESYTVFDTGIGELYVSNKFYDEFNSFILKNGKDSIKDFIHSKATKNDYDIEIDLLRSYYDYAIEYVFGKEIDEDVFIPSPNIGWYTSRILTEHTSKIKDIMIDYFSKNKEDSVNIGITLISGYVFKKIKEIR